MRVLRRKSTQNLRQDVPGWRAGNRLVTSALDGVTMKVLLVESMTLHHITRTEASQPPSMVLSAEGPPQNIGYALFNFARPTGLHNSRYNDRSSVFSRTCCLYSSFHLAGIIGLSKYNAQEPFQSPFLGSALPLLAEYNSPRQWVSTARPIWFLIMM